MRIRSDLVGVVYVESLVLRAGDTIPDGVTVGDHLFEPDGTDAPEEADELDPDGSEAPALGPEVRALEGSEPVDGEAQSPESTLEPPAPEPEPEPVVVVEPEAEVVPVMPEPEPVPKPKPHAKA